ncbi:8-amino-7-oxononanoate synthase [Corynebacterium sp. ES2794-CONJ1]|uniref:aminotransferase class I/II-fold pyridoxal phosphate-dependent enzyme n=1 Tax=unclassified Corynebacterium TaxID=2624378 RepID=UPI00216AB203|nr:MULTISPECIES: 8-amino-7-oxononanoate synthase [unclassified Corynebacterium]MCS4490739.1 8-amino-7-oxononanoate synthase [Corynebacterium sp. ES2775-CONJ]MCS4492541.1 8-amino-7-oxononanoate synthase [Corynebacterium sp. ES2715-CONJ3]MCS4532642.1 8-amino-7-oxononanoate synthase [Corynebacterium sp. ES2730-CONJ]MCU9520037.1 8-amino-7-oxononanoate synthase [Corynebacterium sp. ES2794-CONJ1]
MTSLNSVTTSWNHQWEAAELQRSPRRFDTAPQPRTVLNGHPTLSFASSDYLGLACDPRVIAAGQKASNLYGAGSGGSRLTSGETIHRMLENQLAEFFGYSDCIFFATGYLCNLGVISALAGPEVTVFSDAFNHASLIDGIKLAKSSQLTIYPHQDFEYLARALSHRTTPHALIISDGVFSMSGSVVDLPRLAQLAADYDAWLLIDDAHGVGTVGRTGRGVSEWAGIKPDILIGTASKALGVEGGFALCSTPVREFLYNHSRSFVYSTAPTPATVGSCSEALRILDTDHQLIARLHEVIGYFYASMRMQSPSVPHPIIPVPIGDERLAITIARNLEDAGIYAPAIRYPTVARGKALLRLCLSALHTEADIDRLVASIVCNS